MSWMSKNGRAEYNTGPDTRPGGPLAVRAPDPKRPGGDGAGAQRDQSHRSTGPGRRAYGYTSRAK